MEEREQNGTDEILNELLVKLFKDIVEIEEKCLITDTFRDISVNDMHIIEAIGLEDCVTEAFAALNPEIVDAVMELGVTQKDSDAVTEVYWDTVNQLFTGFLKQLYQELFEEGME